MRLFEGKYYGNITPETSWPYIECPQGFKTTKLPNGDRAGRYEVLPGQKLAGTSGERCEARTAMGLFPPDSQRWIRWPTFFPTTFVPTPNTRWNIFTQLHQKPGLPGSPNIELHVNTLDPTYTCLELYVKGGKPAANGLPPVGTIPLGQLEIGTLHRFVLEIHLGHEQGLVNAFVDDEFRGSVAEPNLYTDDDEGLYLKQGFYRPDNGPPTRIVHGPIVVGETYEDVL